VCPAGGWRLTSVQLRLSISWLEGGKGCCGDGLDWGMMGWSAETGLGVRMADDCGGGLSVADEVVAWYIIRMRGLRIDEDV
jgi:hypothetical protein